MLTFFCPNCFSELPSAECVCAQCGYDCTQQGQESYDHKLMNALNHPVADYRILAARLLGLRHAQEALPALASALWEYEQDLYFCRAALTAIIEIGGLANNPYRERAKSHLIPLIRKMAGKQEAQKKEAG